MLQAPNLGIVFTAIGVIFVAIAVRDFLNTEGKLTPSRRTWLRMAIIFACVGLGLYVVQALGK